jgi:hypothetical protein
MRKVSERERAACYCCIRALLARFSPYSPVFIDAPTNLCERVYQATNFMQPNIKSLIWLLLSKMVLFHLLPINPLFLKSVKYLIVKR